MDIFKEYQEAGYEPDEMCFNTVICAFARCVPTPINLPNAKSTPPARFSTSTLHVRSWAQCSMLNRKQRQGWKVEEGDGNDS
jgi:hypothetical protein